jgi:hypothetical protein
METNNEKLLLSFRQYAKHRGCSPQTVSNAVADQRISTIKKIINNSEVELIDPDIADEEWEANTKTEYRNLEAHQKFTSAVSSSTSLISFGEAPPPNPFDSRAWSEAYKAKLAQVEFERAIGALLPAHVVEKVWTKMLSNFRARMIAVAPKISPMLQGLEDINEIEKIIKDEVYEGLDELSEFDIEEYIKEGIE